MPLVFLPHLSALTPLKPRLLPVWALVLGLGVAVPGLKAQAVVEADLAPSEQVVMVPATGPGEHALEVTLYRPAGEGPFPVVVINHGRNAGDARLQPRFRPLLAAREFMKRGYLVVAPMRQGFSKSAGQEVTGGCNVYRNGLEQARNVRRTLDWLGQQPWADVSRNVVMGQSHGGLTTLAYGTHPHLGTRLLVNFAGGLRQEGCAAWEQNLVGALSMYGLATRLPSLWFYGDNDSYFAPKVWRNAHDRYQQSGGQAELVAFGSFGSDAHTMFGSRAGLPIWLPRVLVAMQAQGLPVTAAGQVPEDLVDIRPPAPSAFARLDDLDRLPTRHERAREGYLAWLHAEAPKAFAVHPTQGSWASAWGGDRPYARALANCERFARAPCKLYAVDDAVVWPAE